MTIFIFFHFGNTMDDFRRRLQRKRRRQAEEARRRKMRAELQQKALRAAQSVTPPPPPPKDDLWTRNSPARKFNLVKERIAKAEIKEKESLLLRKEVDLLWISILRKLMRPE